MINISLISIVIKKIFDGNIDYPFKSSVNVVVSLSI